MGSLIIGQLDSWIEMGMWIYKRAEESVQKIREKEKSPFWNRRVVRVIRAEKNGIDAGTGTENFLEQNTDTKNLIEKRENQKPNGVFLYSLIYSSLYSYYGVQKPPLF